MITEKWLKEELDKIDDRIYWEIEGCGNIEHVINVFNKYLETQVKLCNKPAVSNNEVPLVCETCKYLGMPNNGYPCNICYEDFNMYEQTNDC